MSSTSGTVTFWLDAAGRYPILPKHEVLRLGEIIQKETSTVQAKQKAVTKLVSHNLRLIPAVVTRCMQAKKSLHFGDDSTSDFLQSGVFGLRKAAERFDPTRGYEFSTYAWMWIYQSIQRELYRNLSMIKVPEAACIEMYKSIEKNDNMSFSDIPESRRQRFFDVLDAMQCFDYDSLIDEQNLLERSFTCRSANGSKIFNDDDIENFSLMESFEQILAKGELTEEQKEILSSLYQKSISKKDIAKQSGLSISRVRTIHRKSLRQLKQAISC